MNKELQGLAWSSLPKEFKEEVKNRYKNALRLNEYAHLCVVYRELFREHNLTSGAEGEEMLTVPRKKVQEMYAEIINDIRDYNGENPEMVGTTDPILRERAVGMKAQLHRLFGSKCLPDNVDSSEPKPAEPKFKVGQLAMFKGRRKVEIIGYSDHTPKLYRVFVLTENYHITAHESDLEPYTEPEKGSRNLSQNIVNCDKQFDNILKDSFSQGQRLNIATQMVKAIMQCPEIVERIASAEADSLLDDILHDALYLTDRLIDKCEKGGKS